MYISVRDAMVAGDEFASPAAGMRHLGVDAAEIALNRDFTVLAMDSKGPYYAQDRRRRSRLQKAPRRPRYSPYGFLDRVRLQRRRLRVQRAVDHAHPGAR